MTSRCRRRCDEGPDRYDHAETQKYPRFLSERFEVVIERNRQRGYALHSWQVNHIPTMDGMNETIIAVFRKAS